MKIAFRCVNLTLGEIDYLETAGFLPSDLRECLRSAQWSSTNVATLELSPTTTEEFREIFTEQLASAGFDEAYEPTTEGVLLEDLIARFHAS